MARVLIVDDASFMRTVLGDLLTGAGHEVVGEAKDGFEAVEQFQILRPELITLDVTMPAKDGLSALAEIMAIDPAARVVMCSSFGHERKVLESIRLGARDFVVKPFEPDHLVEAVDRALT